MEFITPIVEYLMVPVKRHLGYLFCSSNNVREMHAKANQLNAAAEEMKRKEAAYKANSLVVPHRVPGWLTEFETINGEVGRIPTGGDGCFNIMKRYKEGKKSSNIIKRIEDLEEQEPKIKWTKEQIPLAMAARFSEPSTSGTGHADDDGTQNVFTSRKLIYEDVLKALDPSNKTQRMALCGLGGVGKTTMMEEVKKAVELKKMFDCVVRVVIGEKTDLIGFQQAIAEFIGLPLSDTAEVAREDRLRKKFLAMSENGTKKILVILDDVWKTIDLKVVGLSSPLPSGFKLLLTSRDEKVCIKMDVETNYIFKMVGLKEAEAKLLFWQTVGLSDGDGVDGEFHELGEDIIKMCGGLPLAIKTIASSLRGDKTDAWKVALLRLQRHDLKDLDDIMQHIFLISYDNLKEDDKAIFVLSGLFPDDFNIPVEDLTRYGWGLKLFYEAYSLVEARLRTNASVDNLIRANLLAESHRLGCVNMHDLARAFVLNNISKFKQVSIVNHGNHSEWPKEDTRECCERILLNCRGMSKFAQDFNYPNLVLLKLMTNQEENLEFPKDFYKRMGKLEVISYQNLEYPSLPVSLQWSTSLRTLCLRSCSLPVDISFLGDLINLEVLSFAYCGVQKLPSTIRKLSKLKLLDLTGCADLRVDDGVFLELDNLEELYMRVSKGKYLRFTEDSCHELEIHSEKLIALEIEFFQNILKPKNVSFKQLDRFRISMGCPLSELPVYYWKISYSFKNTLKLVTNSTELLECKINELFVKTEEVELSVKDLNHLEEILPHQSHHSFRNLKILSVSNCAHLTRLFTIPLANGMTKLESLTISSCPVLESLIHDESSGVRKISFPKLKSLTLRKLPKLVSLCETAINVMELQQLMVLELDDLPNITNIFPWNNNDGSSTQPFLSKKVVIPKLEILRIKMMENLKEIWSCSSDCEEEIDNNISMLRKLKVEKCDGIVNMFPSNPMRLLSHLEEVEVENCGSIEVLFNIEIKDVENNYPPLLIRAFEAVESIVIKDCEKFRNVFTPTTTHFDMGALKMIHIYKCGKLAETDSQEQEINVENVAFSSHQLTHTCHQLRQIHFQKFEGVEVVFDIQTAESSQSINRELVLLPSLEELRLQSMNTVTHVWKCNWNEFLILHMKHQPQSPSFQNLTTIHLFDCKSIKYLFSPLMARLLCNLKEIRIEWCHGMEEVVSNRDDEDEDEDVEINTTTLFPHLQTIQLARLNKLKHIGGGVAAAAAVKGSTKFNQVNVVSWSLCQYSRHILIDDCPSIMELFETREINNAGSCSRSTNVDQGSTSTTLTIPRPKEITMHKLPNLKTLEIRSSDQLAYVFTFSILESLGQLEKLSIKECKAMNVIIREETGEQTMASKVVIFPRLKSIELDSLPNLEGFYLGKNDFQWPLLDYVMIKDCPLIKVFTIGESIAPKLNYIHTQLGKHNLECGLNFHLTPTSHQTLSSNLDDSSSLPSVSQAPPWSFQNLIEVKVDSDSKLKNIVPWNELPQLQKLEKIDVSGCRYVEEVFEVANSGFNEESKTDVVKFPKLREVKLGLRNLKYIWKSNQWRILEFPSLTTLYIYSCIGLKHVLTCSMVGSLMQLQYLRIRNCKNVKVIVKEDEEEVCEVANSVFNEESKTDVVKFPKLREVKLESLQNLKYIWKSNQWRILEFPNLTTLYIDYCSGLKHVLTCSMVGSLTQLEYLRIRNCYNVEVIVKEDEEEVCEVANSVFNEESKTDVVKFPKLREVKLENLQNLKYIWKSNQWRILEFPNLTTLYIDYCSGLKHVLTCSMVGSLTQLEYLRIRNCYNVEVIVKEDEEEVCEVANSVFNEESKTDVVKFPKLREVKLENLQNLKYIWKSNQWRILEFPNLTTLYIDYCSGLKHVLTCSMVGSLTQLEYLRIRNCKNVEVIVKEDEEEVCDAKASEIKFPCLKSIELECLPSLMGLCLENEDVLLPSLKTLVIEDCRELKVFTKGHLDVPELESVTTSLGPVCADDDINSFIITKRQEGFYFGVTDYSYFEDSSDED